MTTPGVTLLSLDQPPPRSAPVDTGVWFVAGLADRGPLTPVLIRSLQEFVFRFGDRQTYSVLYDAVEAFFREGGNKVYVSRVVGPNPVTSTLNLLDAGAAISLVATATSPGGWGNNLRVAVTTPGVAGTFRITVTDQNGNVLDTSDDLLDPPAAVAWAAYSANIRLTLGASANDPAVIAATALATGTDDRTNALDAEWKTALDRFTTDLGPGQVSMPGRTTTQSSTDQLSHAAARNRVALLDASDTASDTTLRAAAAAQRSTVNARYGALFAPWAVIPGIAPGTTRTIPYSAIQAGLIARSDVGLSPNIPAAGDNGQSLFAVGLSQIPWSDDIRGTLNDGGVDVARVRYGGVRTYGYRTLVDTVQNPTWQDLSNARLYMAIAARGAVVAEHHLFNQIDGKGLELAKFAGDLTGMLLVYYDEGSLYGATRQEAFNVNVGPTVNTPATIEANELHAVISAKFSPFAERVIIQISKVPITGAVA